MVQSSLEFISTKLIGKSYVILISGKMGVGKTTVATILGNEFLSRGWYAQTESFASAVKDVAYDCFGWNGNKDEKGRKLLQSVGNTGREYDEDIWCKRLTDRMEDTFYVADVYIIDDWRFPNEKDYFTKNDIVTVLTIRIESDDRGDYYNEDISEVSLPIAYHIRNNLDYYDFIFYNNGDLEELKEKLLTVVETVEKLED